MMLILFPFLENFNVQYWFINVLCLLSFILRFSSVHSFFKSQWIEVLSYSKKLTIAPDKVTEIDVISLREHGFDDGQILEINQVTSYFSYANRTVLGLGVNTKGDTLGLSPSDSDDPDNWSHKWWNFSICVYYWLVS